MEELRTARALLRSWTDDDLQPFAEMCADPLVMAHFPAPLSRAESDATVARVRAHFVEHGYGLWAVEIDGGFAGWTGLSWSEVTGTRELEIGWRLARVYWGRGLATEAAGAALAYGLQQVSRIVSFSAVSNERSWRLMERIGMRREREFDHPRADLPERLRRHVLYVADRQTCRPHSVFAEPAQRPARGSSPGATRRVQGAQPMDG
ncbi:MAG: GNAT family N-acetyltransferase [Actinomycetota bacterium]|nr:GNAT family N-acetyltransferase [Actinomycetota bacterium]